MFARALFVLMSTISTVSYADDGQLLIQFKSFTGQGCALQPDAGEQTNGALYIDRDYSAKFQAPLGIEGQDRLKSHLLSLKLSAIPAAADREKVSLRFYGLHSITSAKHYRADLLITQDLVAALPGGRFEERALATSVDDERGFKKKSKCTLTVQLMKAQ